MKTVSRERFQVEDEVDWLLLNRWAKFRHSMCGKVLMFLILMALNAADIISDWLLFADVSQTEKGLVYGPPSDVIIFSLLGFSILGSVVFVLETINHGKHIFTDNPWIDVDLASAIAVWFEDIPQIALNIAIAACREQSISYFQLAKASVVIIGVVIRIVISLVKYCSSKSLAEAKLQTPDSERHLAYRILVMLGLLIMAAGSITVFMFTQTRQNPDGTLEFNVPTYFFEGEYNEERYFDNVSMYFNHRSFNDSGKIGSHHLNWIRVVSIYDISNSSDGHATFRYKYTAPDINGKSKILFHQSNTQGMEVAQDCYEIDWRTDKISIRSNCDAIMANQVFTEIIFRFQYFEPRQRLVLGDIKYNLQVKVNGTCRNVSTVADSIEDSEGITDVFGIIHYYRLHPGLDNAHHMLQHGVDADFYHEDNDFTDISEVWKTGFTYCESTGSLAPHIDTNIKVPCEEGG